ncbi:MAG: glycosyltransferase family 2 protein, partial [Candidatus Solibacter sp.]
PACELSVVIPCFHESAHLEASVGTVTSYVEQMTSDYEIILVDDGSRDATWGEIQRLHNGNSKVYGLRLSRNFGKEAAVAAGLEHADGAGVLILDADLQHPPALIPRFIELWRTGEYDIVEGRKRGRGHEGVSRRLLSGAFGWAAARFTGIDWNDSSDYKLLSRSAVEAWKRMPERHCFFRGMVHWVGMRSTIVEFDVAARTTGSSKWTFFSLLGLGWSAIRSYSAAPLRVIHLLALVFFVFAIWLGSKALYLKLTGQAVDGFTTVILLVLILGAFLLMGLAVIAEFIIAIYDEVKARPRYVVSEWVGAETRVPAASRPSSTAGA